MTTAKIELAADKAEFATLSADAPASHAAYANKAALKAAVEGLTNYANGTVKACVTVGTTETTTVAIKATFMDGTTSTINVTVTTNTGLTADGVNVLA